MATLSSRLLPLTVSVPAASEWVSFTPTISGLGTGSTASNTALWRRVGDSVYVMFSFQKDGSSGTGVSNVTVSLPSSLTVDTAKLPNTLDSATVVGDSQNAATPRNTTYGTTTSINTGFSGSDIGANTYTRGTFVVPISGWTSHTASSTLANAVVVGGQSVGSTMNFGATSNQGFNILANNVAAIASTAAGALTLGLPSAIGGSTYAGQAIVGRTDGTAPAAGYVGQSVEGTQTSLTNFPATTTWGDGTSISLTSGRWMISAVIDSSLSGSTISVNQFGVSTTSGNSTTGLVVGDSQLAFSLPTSTLNSSSALPMLIRNITATTVFYLKVSANYSAGNPQYRCRLTAIRIA